MKRRAAGRSASLTLLILAAVVACAAVVYLRFDNDSTVRPIAPPGARGPDGVVSGAGTITNPLPAGGAPASNPAVTPNVPPSNPPHPAVVLPPEAAQFPYSYLAGRTPSEVRPDGTQVFKDVPFYVTQPDGSKVTHLTTITIQPAPVMPVKDESKD